MGEFAATAGTDLLHGVQHMLQELREGYLVPAIAGKKNPKLDDSSIEQLSKPA